MRRRSESVRTLGPKVMRPLTLPANLRIPYGEFRCWGRPDAPISYRTKGRTMRLKNLITMLAISALVVAACSSDSGAEPGDVLFDVELIEVKGATDGIPAPDVDPTSLSRGYGYKAPGDYDPDNPDKFQVATYMFAPGAMTVAKGDAVTLRMFGVNGDEHVMFVQAPDGSTVVEAFTVNRGREDTVSFTADQTGHYKLICSNHSPTMTADIFSTG